MQFRARNGGGKINNFSLSQAFGQAVFATLFQFLSLLQFCSFHFISFHFISFLLLESGQFSPEELSVCRTSSSLGQKSVAKRERRKEKSVANEFSLRANLHSARRVFQKSLQSWKNNFKSWKIISNLAKFGQNCNLERPQEAPIQRRLSLATEFAPKEDHPPGRLGQFACLAGERAASEWRDIGAAGGRETDSPGNFGPHFHISKCAPACSVCEKTGSRRAELPWTVCSSRSFCSRRTSARLSSERRFFGAPLAPEVCPFQSQLLSSIRAPQRPSTKSTPLPPLRSGSRNEAAAIVALSVANRWALIGQSNGHHCCLEISCSASGQWAASVGQRTRPTSLPLCGHSSTIQGPQT